MSISARAEGRPSPSPGTPQLSAASEESTMDLSLSAFLNLPESDRIRYVGKSAILYAQQFDRSELDAYCQLADACRAVHKSVEGADFLASLLPNRIGLNFFVQPSSRTFLSFSAAQAILGMKRMSLRDEKISSISKGETLADSIRTFISYVDLVVMRHSDDDAGTTAFWIANQSHRRLQINGQDRPIPIVSGGSGSRQHPTQALLDIYTLEKSFERVGGIDGKTLMLVGDLKRGRTVRSLSYLMKNFKDVTLLFAAPPKYQMLDDILEFLDNHDISYRKLNSIDEGVAEADAIYMTRIQDEWDSHAPGMHEETAADFRFRLDHLNRMKDEAYLLHPLPKRDEIAEDVDYADDPRVVYWRQERNGMWMRVGIIARLFGVDQAILDYHAAH
jgi:aspartate carbamoyltransferase catalytic subunit